jgi:hypothetical protein
MECPEHVVCMVGAINAENILDEKSKRKRPHGIPRHRQGYNNGIDFM